MPSYAAVIPSVITASNATGAVTYKSWHLSGFTPEEEQAIYNEVTK